MQTIRQMPSNDLGSGNLSRFPAELVIIYLQN